MVIIPFQPWSGAQNPRRNAWGMETAKMDRGSVYFILF
jgi:hypothetical protein